MKNSTTALSFFRRARGIALAVLAAAISLLALYGLYAPLVRGHGPAAPGDQLAQIVVRDHSLPYPFDFVM